VSESKIKILYGLEASDGGSLKHLRYLVLNLDPSKFEIFVILSVNRSPRVFHVIDEFVLIGVNVIIISMSREINLIGDFAALLKIRGVIKKHKFDIIHSHSSKAGALFRVAGWCSNTKINLYTPHSFYFQAKSGISEMLYCFVERLLANITSAIIVSSNEKQIALEKNIIAEKKLININNGIKFADYTEEEKETSRITLSLSSKDVIIGSLGRLSKQKNWELFIQAAALVSTWHDNVSFLIAGDGEEYDNLVAEISRLKLQNRFILKGYVENVNTFLSAIDIFVSSSSWEGLPYALLEAMYFRKPIIASHICYDDILDDNNAILLEDNTPECLAIAIHKLINSRNLRDRIKSEAYTTVTKTFSNEKFIQYHEDLYRKLLKRQ
jgi:glycosyltransferase involved in cell wall biosynthesis